jgi:hypothetical protein
MNRKCGSCTLCCRLLPVRELAKGANERCRFQRHTGCSVYHRPPAFPRACGLWSCAWLIGEPATEGLRRPDRSGYVIDMMPDLVKVTDKDSGEIRELLVLQVWVDPARRDAWQDPALLRYAESAAREHQMGMLIRYSSSEAVAVLAPSLCADGQWHTIADGTIAKSETGSMLLDRLRREVQDGP